MGPPTPSMVHAAPSQLPDAREFYPFPRSDHAVRWPCGTDRRSRTGSFLHVASMGFRFLRLGVPRLVCNSSFRETRLEVAFRVAIEAGCCLRITAHAAVRDALHFSNRSCCEPRCLRDKNDRRTVWLVLHRTCLVLLLHVP